MVVKHLPPTVKQLLTLRTPQPRPTPSLPRLTAVLSSTFQDAKAKKAERGWLTLAVRFNGRSTHETWNADALFTLRGIKRPFAMSNALYEDVHASDRERAPDYRAPVPFRDAGRLGERRVASRIRRGLVQGRPHARVRAEELYLRWGATRESHASSRVDIAIAHSLRSLCPTIEYMRPLAPADDPLLGEPTRNNRRRRQERAAEDVCQVRLRNRTRH